MQQTRSSLLRPPATRRFFRDPTDRQQSQPLQSTSADPTKTFLTMASNRPNAASQSSIPAPSQLRQPTPTLSATINKRTVSQAATVSKETPKNPSTTASSTNSTPAFERNPAKPLVRRDSYTISSGDAPGKCPVIISGPSSPIDNRSPADGRTKSNVLNTTINLSQPTTPSQRQFGETEFRHHLHRPVCIGGAKRGTLRYFGPLHMVDGLFCGIELDEPAGQHDGKVDGRRYFRAGYNRGIFAPMDKVDLIGHEPSITPVLPPPAAAELIIPPDAEFLTDVEPQLMSQSFVRQSNSASGNDSFDLSESLMFLKGSRFHGMDVSMTPSELAALLCGGQDSSDDVGEEEINQGRLRPEDLETGYLMSGHRSEEEDIEDSTTPVSEQPLQLGANLPATSMTPSNGRDIKTAGTLNTTITYTPEKVGDNLRQAGATMKERPISTVSADTGYQGDTEFETQSGRSASPKEMDGSFEQRRQAAANVAGQASSHKFEPSSDHNGGVANGSLEYLSCETTVRDSQGRVVKVMKEVKPIPTARLRDLNDVNSLVQLTDTVAPSDGVVSTAPSSETSRAKATSERKPAKSAKLGETKGNGQRSEDNSRPSSGSPRKNEKVDDSAKKVVKAQAKPSKHSEIMAKLQQSMAHDKQKPKKEVKSKFMTLAAGSAGKSDDKLLSFLPTPLSRAVSNASSVVSGTKRNDRSPTSGAPATNESPSRGSDSLSFSNATSPLEEKRAPTESPQEPVETQQSPPAKGVNVAKQAPSTVTTQTKNGISSAAKKSTLVNANKTTGSGIGQVKNPPGRPTSGRPTATSAISNGLITPRPVSQKSPTNTKDASKRVQELETQAEQLKLAKERLRNSARGFEALSVLIRYYVEQVIPKLHSDHGLMRTELELKHQENDHLTKANEKLQLETRQATEAHAKTLDKLSREHEQKMGKLEADLKSSYEDNVKERSLRHGEELSKIRDENEREMKKRSQEFEARRKAECEKFESKIASLVDQHGRELIDLKALHQKNTDDLWRRFEEEKSSLSLKMDELQQLCDRYKQEARHLEETLSKDTEKKMAAVSERFDTYQREIDSLQAVLEMKNKEMHELRAKCSLLDKELEELPKCQAKIALLEQKNAELKEALDLKKQAEKLFYQQHAELMQSCERERERSQRLSMDKEQLEFKLQKLIMSQSAYETPTHRKPSDDLDGDSLALRCRTAPRPATAGAAFKDKPMSQSLIQIYAESSPWSPRSSSRAGQHHDGKDLPVTVYMAAQDGDVAKVLQFDPDGECSTPSKANGRNGDRKAPGYSSSDSLASPQTPPCGARSVDKMSSPKRRISPLRRRNISVSSAVAPMPATPEHPIDNGTSERMNSEPPPDCPKSEDANRFYDGHDPQDPAPHIDCLNAGAKTGGMPMAACWTDSGVFTTSCSSDTQEIISGTVDQDATIMATSILSSSKCSDAVEKYTVPVSDNSKVGASVTASDPKKGSV